MKKLLSLLALLFCIGAQAEVWEARYGVAETFNFKLYNADGTLDVDEADGGTEVSVSCNEGAETTATNDFADEGTFYSISLTAAELQCERVAVVVAATTTEVFFIQTTNHASAMTPLQWSDVQNFGGSAGTFASGIPAVNATQISGDSTAADNVENSYDDTAGAVPHQGIVDQGTAQAVTGTTLRLRSAAAFADDEIIGATCVITGGSAGVGQSRTVTDYVSSTDTATVATWTTTPTGTITYKCYGTAAASGSSGATAAEVWAYATRSLTELDEDNTTLDINTTAIGNVITVNAGAISSGSFATDAITSAVVAASAVTEIQSGLATAAALTTVDDLLDTEIGAIISALTTIDDFIDTEIAAIKAKTDSLTFTKAGEVDANTQSINGATMTGDGDATPFDVTP